MKGETRRRQRGDRLGPGTARKGRGNGNGASKVKQSGEYGKLPETQRGVLSARPPLLNHLAAAAYGRLIHSPAAPATSSGQ